MSHDWCSDNLDQLIAAVIAFQQEMGPLPKDGTNPHLGTKFTTLTAMIEATRVPLARHGLTVTHLSFIPDPTTPALEDTKDAFTEHGEKVGETVKRSQLNGVRTVLMHTSGQWIAGKAMMHTQPEKGTSFAQQYGIADTYLVRYGLRGILNLASDDDTDGASPAPAPASDHAPRTVGTRGPGRQAKDPRIELANEVTAEAVRRKLTADTMQELCRSASGNTATKLRELTEPQLRHVLKVVTAVEGEFDDTTG